ncbi:hypothetical protein GCM10011519_22820 [Marmoricola endophyticus]|uniref:AB hydrolase-1 domain-containing protein n=1 Tax=Marmoricola endophyticus TaxID=2040280 RepID=A0A917F4U2_9ACTN|nr:alpha/beta hydrolase [Marmoricola endophyticus]GGF48273.1 hypothetical protein GCM10011519_22820 [Marmoricola endophyticus]
MTATLTGTSVRTGYVELRGALAFVEDVGEGPVVLLVHTAGQSGVQWRRTTPDLVAAGYRVVVPDLPGHGRSEPDPAGPVDDLGEYAAWLLDLLDELGVDRFAVVGCSIGGKITLDLACRAPDRIDAAVAMAAVGGRPGLSEAGQRRELEDSASPSRGDRTYLGTLASVGGALPESEARMVATMHRREDPVVSTTDLVAWSRHDVSGRLDRVTCPLHVVAGAEDYWIDQRAVRATAAAVPHARCTVLDGVGHYPMEELPEFGRVAAAWLADLRTDR